MDYHLGCLSWPAGSHATLMAFAPWVSIRFIHDPVGDPGFFYVDGCKRLARQLCCQVACILFSLPPKPFSGCHAACIPCTKHTDVAVMQGAAAAGFPPASSPARPDGPSSPDAAMLRITSSGLPDPLPSAPKGAPSCVIVPQSRHSHSLRDGTVTALAFWFLFLRSLRLPGDLALLGRSEAGLTSHRLRGVADDRCAATALPLRPVEPFLFSLRPVPADFALLRLPRPGVIAAVTVTRLPLRSGRVTSSRCFF